MAEPASVLPPTNATEAGFRADRPRCRGRGGVAPCRRASARHADRRRRHRQDTTGPRTLPASCCRNSPTGCGWPSSRPLADPGLVPVTVAAAVGLELGGGEASAQRVAQALANRRMLLVLDTCEHVIDAAAAMAEAVLRGRFGGCISSPPAASRCEREASGSIRSDRWPCRRRMSRLTTILCNTARVRLFVERARAADRRFTPDRA